MSFSRGEIQVRRDQYHIARHLPAFEQGVFRKSFKKWLGVTPGEYRQGASAWQSSCGGVGGRILPEQHTLRQDQPVELHRHTDSRQPRIPPNRLNQVTEHQHQPEDDESLQSANHA